MPHVGKSFIPDTSYIAIGVEHPKHWGCLVRASLKKISKSTMSFKKSASNYILNTYLYEQHCVHESIDVKRRSSSEPLKHLPRPQSPVKDRSPERGVKELDRFMRSVTDERILQKARKEQELTS